jgi:DNA-binding MarR family transcriptional regulator
MPVTGGFLYAGNWLFQENGMSADITPLQALKIWHDVALEQVHDDDADLTPRQMAILLTIYLESPPHTVRDLAARLRVTKPVITRALNAMGSLGLVKRRRDEADRRNVLIQRTVEGSLYLDRLSQRILRHMEI